jgi:Trypsin-like peptidase domain
MFHEPPPQFLYSSYRVETTHVDPHGTTKKGVATGFVVEGKPGVGLLVTNRHVVDLDFRQATPKYKNFNLQDFHLTGRRSDDSSYTLRLHPDARVFRHTDEENDVVLVEPRCIWEGVPEDQWSLHWHFGREQLADSAVFNESMQPFDLVCYTGFPDQHDKLGNRPVLRSGHIASDPQFDYSWDKTHHGSCVAYEGFSFAGSSGSPVFAPPRGAAGIPNSRHGFLVGVNAGHVLNHPSGHSGISYFYKSSIILEIMAQHSLD